MVNNPTITPLTAAQKLEVQQFVGVFRHYASAIDTTMLAAISSIATNMSTATAKDLHFRMKQFLDYAATHPNAKIRYTASAMKLWIHSDASYLSEPKARSRAGGFYYLSDAPKCPVDATSPSPPLNGSILVLCKIIDAIMSSAQEAETGAAFLNTREAIPIKDTLEELGHPQGPIPIQLDNKCAVGIINDTMTQRRSKPMDMRFYWLKDREIQKQINVYWKKDSQNLGDYPTKHHPAKHHQEVRPLYVANATTQSHARIFNNSQSIDVRVKNPRNSARVC